MRKRLSAGRNTLIIAHRLSTVADADRVLVVEQCRDHQVLDRGGHYAKMLARQQDAPAG